MQVMVDQERRLVLVLGSLLTAVRTRRSVSFTGTDRPRPARRWRGPVAGGLACVLLPVAAYAKLCGTHVGGQAVSCACGDVVASDLILGDDPVTTTVCAGNGLVV